MFQRSQRLRGHDFKNIFTKTKKLSRPGLPVHMGPRYSFLITNKYRKQGIKVSINKPRRQVQHFYKSGDGGTFFKAALSGERTHLIKFSIPSYTIFIRSSFVSPLFSNIADSNPLLLSLSLWVCEEEPIWLSEFGGAEKLQRSGDWIPASPQKNLTTTKPSA